MFKAGSGKTVGILKMFYCSKLGKNPRTVTNILHILELVTLLIIFFNCVYRKFKPRYPLSKKAIVLKLHKKNLNL